VTGTGGPQVAFTVPTGGRFVNFAAECQAKQSVNNTYALWFAVVFSSDGGASWATSPVQGYDTSLWYPDTSTGGPVVAIGASQWLADMTYRPLRAGQNQAPWNTGTTTTNYQSLMTQYFPAGSWLARMRYGIPSSQGGTAYFKSRRLRAQVLPN
jgi:hypothetical protein